MPTGWLGDILSNGLFLDAGPSSSSDEVLSANVPMVSRFLYAKDKILFCGTIVVGIYFIGLSFGTASFIGGNWNSNEAISGFYFFNIVELFNCYN